MTTPNRPPPTLTPSRPFVSTPCRTPGTGRRHRKSIILSAPKTPRDVRQLGRDEMIEYLVQNDQENPENLDQMMRADLQKRVIHCMKGLKRREVGFDSPFPTTSISEQWPQTADPKTRFTRKRRADCPLTGGLYKKMKMTNHEPLPVKNLMNVEQEQKEEEQSMDFSSLRRLSISPLANPDELWSEQLLQRVKKGIPARYDILPLEHTILNTEQDTGYLRSAKMQKMYEVCHTARDLSCEVRTEDDVYQLNDEEIAQIQQSVSNWILKNGEYSSNIHPSIRAMDGSIGMKLCATNHIFQYEVLGRFIGDEMVENEFQEIYAGTFDEYRRSLHSWVFEVDIPILEGTGCTVNGDNVKYEQFDMLVDCLGKSEKAPSKLLWIKDCREDFSEEITTKEDLKKENVLFVTIEINGWPGKFAIAKRTIEKDERLYGHFGDGYGSLKQHVKRQQESVDYFVSSIKRLLDQRNEESMMNEH